MELIRLYRDRLRESPEFRELQKAFEGRAQMMQQARDDLLRQLHVDTATWGLSLFEKAYGLRSLLSITDHDQRARIKAKMRGVGVTTVEALCGIAAGYGNGDADILEIIRDYSFNVRLNSLQGLPPGLESLAAAIEELKPAHLAFQFVTAFRSHRELVPFRHCDLCAYNHETLRAQILLSWATYKDTQIRTHGELADYSHREISLGQLDSLVIQAELGGRWHNGLSGETHFSIRHGLRDKEE